MCSAPKLLRQSEGRRGTVDRDHLGAQGNCDLHSAEAHTAGPDDRHPFAGPDAGTSTERAVGSGEPAAQSSRRRITDDFGDCDQVGVGSVQGHIFGERTPMGETRLGLVRAHLRLTVQAPLARAAAAHERCCHSVAYGPSSYVGADRDHYADQFVTGNVWERHPVVMPGPRVPVTATKSRGVNFYDDASRRGLRIDDGPHLHRTTELFKDRSAHDAMPLTSRGCGRRRRSRVR